MKMQTTRNGGLSFRCGTSWFTVQDSNYAPDNSLVVRKWQPHYTRYNDVAIHQLLRHRLRKDWTITVISEFSDFYDYDKSENWSEYELVYDFLTQKVGDLPSDNVTESI